MAKYYAFLNKDKNTFVKTNNLKDAIHIAGNSGVVYQHVKEIPNPWYIHPVENGKVNKSKILFKDGCSVKDVSSKYLK
jgi:hypothetical protein